MLTEHHEPSDRNHYLLNGDIADRGDHACEILLLVLLYQQLYPKGVMINRGRHPSVFHGALRVDEVCIPRYALRYSWVAHFVVALVTRLLTGEPRLSHAETTLCQ